jgi:mannose-6-phosphate isomerase-like protein (cupin superfamily)
MKMKIKITLVALFITALASLASAQMRQPAEAVKPYVVKTRQEVSALEKSLHGANKVEDLTGGPGTQLRVAIQHDHYKENADAESHDASDDVYYVLEGEAKLTLGGKLELPREVSPGEWRAKSIVGGKTFIIKKGDLIIVPRGTPHQRFSTKKGKVFSLILVKIFAEPLPPTK